MQNQGYFEFEVSDASETGLVVVSLRDRRTGFVVRTVLPGEGKQTASIMAFAGARYSRSGLSVVELLKEIQSAGTDANVRLGSIFRAYGHASVADMAQLFAYMEDLPRFMDMKFFYETSVGAGQARSTRFQDYSNSQPRTLRSYLDPEVVYPPDVDHLEQGFQHLQQIAFDSYTKFKEVIFGRFQDFYQTDPEDKKQLSALKARTLDAARYFLPHGTGIRTSFCWITSAREWARLIGLFKANYDWQVRCLGEQLEMLFAPDEANLENLDYTPEASELIRYTGSDETTANSLHELKEVLPNLPGFNDLPKYGGVEYRPLNVELLDWTVDPGVKVLMQNILSIYPTLREMELLRYLVQLPDELKERLAGSVMGEFDHHRQMGNQFRVNTHSFLLTTSIIEASDLNRHRAWGRFMPMFSCNYNFRDLLSTGYTLPLYLTDNPELSDVRELFETVLKQYYDLLDEFARKTMEIREVPEHILLQLLPFGHAISMVLHGSPKEISYLTKLRTRPGGHINYRTSAWMMAQKAAQSSPFLRPLGQIPKPDPKSREEFLDRS